MDAPSEQHLPPLDEGPRPFGRVAYCSYWIGGVVLPTVCQLFCLSGTESGPSYQSGNMSDYAQLMLTNVRMLPLLPLTTLAAICLGLLLVDWSRFRDHAVIRFGVATGVILSGHFTIVLCTAMQWSAGIIGLLLVSLLVSGFVWGGWIAITLLIVDNRRIFQRRGGNVSAPSPFAVVFAVMLILVVATLAATDLIALLLLPLVFAFFGSPVIALMAYAGVLWRLLRHREGAFQFRLTHMFGALAWFAGYMGAVRTSYLLAMQRYALLPPEPPPDDCYVCTAAARGHARLVGSWEVAGESGALQRVNRQMQTLKAGELILRAVAPHLHRGLRRVYDWLGPRLAARLTHRLAADAAYFSLKPCEWATRVMLRVVLGKDKAIVASLYDAQHETSN